MNNRIWVNSRQPQTLYISQLLMYFNGILAILFGRLSLVGRVHLFGSAIIGTVVLLLVTVGMVVSAYGIANERKWGYRLGVVSSLGPFVITLAIATSSTWGEALAQPISIMFDVALVALLLHPMSTAYQKIWFK